MKLMILLIAGLMLSACVSMDVSTLNTAVPLGEGNLRLGTNAGFGASLTSINEWNEIIDDSDDDGIVFPGAYLAGIDASYGVTSTSDVSGKIWMGIGSAGGRLAYKHVFPQTENDEYLAFMPSVAASYSEWVHGANGEQYQDYLGAGGVEGQVLYTKVVSEYFQATLNAQFGSYLYHEWDGQHGESLWGNISRLGAGGNLRFGVKPLFLTIEPGAQVFVSSNGGFSYLPYAMVGLSIDLE